MFSSREIATQILNNIYTKLDFFETAILQNKNFNRLEPRDKAFRSIILNTLDEMVKLWNINEFVRRPLKKRYFYFKSYKNFYLPNSFPRIKEYSIVNSAVQIAKNYKFDKFVNGVLRSICRNKTKILKDLHLKQISRIKKDIKNNLGADALIKISKTIVKEPYLDIKVKKIYRKKKLEKILNGESILNDIIRIKNDGPIEKNLF